MEGTLTQSRTESTAQQGNEQDAFHTVMTISDAEGGLIVPQKVYVPPATDVTQSFIIRFWQYGRRGVSMKEAIESSFVRGDEASTGMTNGNDPVEISSQSNKVKIRVNWPGCQTFSKDINIETTKDGDTQKISIAKLINSIAKALKGFCAGGQKSGRVRSDDWNKDGNLGWSLDGRIGFDQLILHELHHVSRGSWQLVLLANMGNVNPSDIGMESDTFEGSNPGYADNAVAAEGGDDE